MWSTPLSPEETPTTPTDVKVETPTEVKEEKVETPLEATPQVFQPLDFPPLNK